jgi:hypothetical protein
MSDIPVNHFAPLLGNLHAYIFRNNLLLDCFTANTQAVAAALRVVTRFGEQSWANTACVCDATEDYMCSA